MSDTSTLFRLLADRSRRRLLIQLCAQRTLRLPGNAQTGRASVLGAPIHQSTTDNSEPILKDGEPSTLSHADEELLVELRHVHLPKLESAGVIDWDQDDDSVSRGPTFEQYEPALRALVDAADTFPDSLV